MKNLPPSEIWYVTGSQHLYGEGPLRQVAANSQKIVAELKHGRRAVDAHVFTLQDVDRRPSLLAKPVLHLHTQLNRDLPWADIDMDSMNLNQAAHGDREHGFIHTRLRLRRKARASTARTPTNGQ